MIETLARLVSIDSVNPEWGGPGEAGVAAFVAERLESWGAEVWVDEVLPGRPNVIARAAGRDSSRAIVLEAHTDTVSVEGMTIPPFVPGRRQGNLYGRGACDTKGGLAAMMEAIRRLVSGNHPPPCDVYLAAVVDEEHAFRGVLAALRWFAARGITPEAAVVAEPTECRLVTANKGVLRFRIETAGRAAHSSKPHLGINAITRMAPVIQAVESYHATLARQAHPLTGPPTGSVTLIEGGQQINFVPSRCSIGIDRRMIPGETAEQVLEDYRRAVAPWEGTEIVRPPTLVDEASETPPETAVVRTGRDVLAAMALPAEPAGVPFGCDVTKFTRAGIPGVIFGPGSIDQAHADVEFVPIAEVTSAAEFYRRFALAYGTAR